MNKELPTDHIKLDRLLFERDKYKFYLDNFGKPAFIARNGEIIEGNDKFIHYFSYDNFKGFKEKNKNQLNLPSNIKGSLNLILKNCYDEQLDVKCIFSISSYPDNEDQYCFMIIEDGEKIESGFNAKSAIVDEFSFKNEKLFRQFAEKVNEGVIIWDERIVHYVNPAFRKIFGITERELNKDRNAIEKLIYPKDIGKGTLIFKRNPSTKSKTQNLKYKIIKGGSEVKWLSQKTFSISRSDISYERFASVITDITGQKELAFSLSNVRTQQRAIMDNIPHLIWLKDSEGKYVSINKAFADYYGKQNEEIIGKTDFDLSIKDIAEKTIRNDIEVMRSKKSQRGEDFSKSVHGNNWIETFKTPILNEEKEVTGITGIAMDITERKKMEVMIRDSEARFRSLLQNSSDAITILDRKGNIIYENAEKGKISDFSYEELWGKSAFNLIHKDDQPLFEEALNYVLKYPKKSRSVEFRGYNVNRKWVYVESILTNQLKTRT